MASFLIPRSELIVFLTTFSVPCVLCIAAAMIAGKPEMLAMLPLLAVMPGMMLYIYPKRVMVTQDQLHVEYYIRRRQSWPLASLTVASIMNANGTKPYGGLLRIYVGDSKKEVFRISHGLLEGQFEPLFNELKSRGVAVSPRVPSSSSSPPRVEVEVDGKREVRYRGGRSALFAGLGICAIVAIGSFMAMSLPWDVPVAEREKLIVCCCVGLLALPAIWLVPRGVMGVVFREDKVTIKRIWRRNLILTKNDIASLTSRKSRIDETRIISLVTQRGEKVKILENALGAYPSQLWDELAEFAGVGVAPTS